MFRVSWRAPLSTTFFVQRIHRNCTETLERDDVIASARLLLKTRQIAQAFGLRLFLWLFTMAALYY